MSGERKMYGLPALQAEKLWVVPSRTAGQFLFVDENIYFM
jgi:hypothetical protein